MADHAIFWGLTMFFIVSGLVVSFVSDELTGSSESFDAQKLTDDTKKDTNILKLTVDFFNIIWTILKMATWSFGSLPLIFEVVFMLPIRVLYYFTIVKVITG